MDARDVDLRLLYILEAIHRAGSLTAAAEALGLSQPAVSHALKQLRKVFEDQLFVRSATGVNPTPKADQLALSARRIQALVRSELGPARPFDPRRLSRAFSLCTTDVAEMVLLPRLLDRVRRQAPAVDVRTLTLSPREMADALDSGVVDLALGPFPELADTALREQRLFERGFVCVISADHPRIGADDGLSVDRFLYEPHLVVSSPGRTEEVFERFLKTNQLARRIVLSVPHMLCVPAVARETDVIATVPHSVGEYFRAYPGIRVLPLPFTESYDPPRTTVSQFWSLRFDKDPAIAWLRDTITELFAEQTSVPAR
ncbi:LysR family transcriptional regulator [Streptomyces fuscichromogenes]|uniref:LysR family transcriptional regulator n=1 Tax=Streptomyces fuscichromogenes TaxID=1324013 RepID=UPI0038297664